MSGKFLIGNMLSAMHNKNAFYDIPVVVEYNYLCECVLQVLCNAGYVKRFNVIEDEGKKSIEIYLKIALDKKVINSFKLLSTPGRRLYANVNELKHRFSYNPYALVIVSTSKGVMPISEAIRNNIGGEVLCEVF